jgi:hypothetical protein
MIFLPYISILQNNDETSQKLNSVQALQDNFAFFQNDINVLRSDLTGDMRRIKDDRTLLERHLRWKKETSIRHDNQTFEIMVDPFGRGQM